MPEQTTSNTSSTTATNLSPVALALRNATPETSAALTPTNIYPSSDADTYGAALEGSLQDRPMDDLYTRKLEEIVRGSQPELQQVPPKGTGTYVRRALMSMIPFVGPALIHREMVEENQQRADVDFQNKLAYLDWMEQQRIARPLLVEEYKRQEMLNRVNRNDAFLALKSPWMTADERRHYATIYAGYPDPGYKEPTYESVYIEPYDVPGAWLPAQKSSENQFFFRHPIKKETVMYGPGEITGQRTLGDQAQMQQGQAPHYQILEDGTVASIDRTGKAILVTDARGEPIKARAPGEAPHYQIRDDRTVIAIDRSGQTREIIGPDGMPLKAPVPPLGYNIQPIEQPGTGQVLFAFNPRQPQAPGIPMTLPSGEAAVRKGELTTQTKSKVDQAWAIDMTARNLYSQLQNPKVLQELGAIAGRVTNMEAKLGTISPEARHLYTTLKSFYALQGLLHGWRAIRVSQEFEEAVGGLKQSPQALAAGIQSIQEMAQVFLEMGQGSGYIPAGGKVEYINGDWYQKGDDGKWHKQAPK